MKTTSCALLGVALLGLPGLAFSQAYKCGTGDQVVYQQAPCAGGTKLRSVPDPPDPNTLEGRVELAIAKRQVFIGMTRSEIVRSWGRPTKNNKSINSRSTHEQWVYERDRITDTSTSILRTAFFAAFSRLNEALLTRSSGWHRLTTPGHRCHGPSAATRHLPPRAAVLERWRRENQHRGAQE